MVTTTTCERGMGLILALLAITILGTAVLVAGNHLQAEVMDHQRELRDVRVVAMSDAAMATTLAHLAADPTWSGLPATPWDGGTIASEVERSADGRQHLTVSARLGDRRAILTASVELTPVGPRVLEWERRLAH